MHLTIKKADKGSCIVVEDTTNYIDNGLSHLQDASIYRQLLGDPTEHKSESISRFIDDLYSQNYIDRHTHLFLKPPNTPRTQRLYFQRKYTKIPPASVGGTLKVLLTHSSLQFHTPLETTTSNLFLPLTSTSPLALISHLTPDSSFLTALHLLTSIKLQPIIGTLSLRTRTSHNSTPQLYFRREKAVSNHLVSAKTLGTPPPHTADLPLQVSTTARRVKPCNHPLCLTCAKLLSYNVIHSSITHQPFCFTDTFTCYTGWSQQYQSLLDPCNQPL